MPEANPPEVSQIPDTTTGAICAAPAPGNSAIPITNPNLESLNHQPLANRTETPSDASSLPPALTGGRLTSSVDAFIPDRVTPPSTLKPELHARLRGSPDARKRICTGRRRTQHSQEILRDTIASDLRTQTQMDISPSAVRLKRVQSRLSRYQRTGFPSRPRNWAPQQILGRCRDLSLTGPISRTPFSAPWSQRRAVCRATWPVLDLSCRRPHAVHPAESDASTLLLSRVDGAPDYYLALQPHHGSALGSSV